MAKQPESNPWPGFVDALSTTLLVFVFLVVVLILVVTALSVQVGFDIAKAVIETQKQAAGKKDDLQSGQQATVDAEIEKEIVSEATDVVLESQVEAEVKEKLIRIKYQDFSSRLTEDAKKDFESWIDEKYDEIKEKPVFIISLLTQKGVAKTVAYEIAFNRITQIRKILVDKGLPSENIKVRLDDSGPEDQRNEVIIKVLEEWP